MKRKENHRLRSLLVAFLQSFFKGPVVFSLLFLFIPQSLHAWGEKGHRIVADIAERRLDERARREIRALLGGESLSAVSDWADRIRESRPETGWWHFVNIPFKAERYHPERDCTFPKKGACVIGAIERFRGVLSGRERSKAERAEALKFLVHLIADLHQPLHTTTRSDHGGNDLPVIFFGEARHLFAPWTLHAVWDSGLIDRTGLSHADYLKHLEGWIVRRPITELQKGGVVDWAMEAHRAAAGAYRIPEDRKLSERYFEESVPVMNELLARAGVRLAKVLNRAFHPKRESNAPPKGPRKR